MLWDEQLELLLLASEVVELDDEDEVVELDDEEYLEHHDRLVDAHLLHKEVDDAQLEVAYGLEHDMVNDGDVQHVYREKKQKFSLLHKLVTRWRSV